MNMDVVRNSHGSVNLTQALDLAVRQFSAGDYNSAKITCQSLVDALPDHFVGWHLLGVIALQTGDHASADQHLERATSLDPSSHEAHNNLGAAYEQSGAHEQALANYRTAISLDPSFAVAHNNLGNVLQGKGDLDKAIKSYETAILLRPAYANAYFNLGATLLAKNQLPDAVDNLRKALSLNPDDFQIYTHLCTALIRMGKRDEAEDCYRAALMIYPDDADTHYHLGNLLLELGRTAEAITSYQAALRYAPDFANAHVNLGNAFQNAGNTQAAQQNYQAALALDPGHVEAHINYGNSLAESGDPHAAVASYRRALSLDPGHAVAHNNLGAVLQELGAMDAAEASYRRALDLNPDNAEAARQLSHILQFHAYDDDIRAMERRYSRVGINDRQKMHLGFALGKAFDDLGQYEEAFGYFESANALKHRQGVYSSAGAARTFARLKTVFAEPIEAPRPEPSKQQQKPIFIVGMMRSGTSLVEQILASHPQVQGGGELVHLRHAVTSRLGDINARAFARRFNQASHKDIMGIGQRYRQSIRGIAGESTFVTDKMPDNFLFIGLIRMALPDATIIHCRRNARDTCLSVFKNYFTANDYYYAYDLTQLGHYYNLYRDLMDHWSRVCPGSIYEIHYENLVADQEQQSRDLLDYCGLDWDDACLHFYRASHPVRTASSAQVRRPIFTNSVNLWEKYEKQLGPLLTALDK